MQPWIDPQGRFLQVRSSGHGFFSGTWIEQKTYSLPMQEADFTIGRGSAFECKSLPCGDPPPLDDSRGDDFPSVRTVSPDGQWWVTFSARPDRVMFFRQDGQQTPRRVATFDYEAPQAAPGAAPSAPKQPHGHQVVFSRDSRWAGLQYRQKLYRVDLRAAQIEPAEVLLDGHPTALELQGIGDNGTDWLLGNVADASFDSTPASGLWRLITGKR